MGAGSLPQGELPALPAHPHCLCRLTEVFTDEAKPGKFNPKRGREFLEKLSDGERSALLGVKGNESFKMGGDWQRHLRGWKESARPFGNRFDARSFDLQVFAGQQQDKDLKRKQELVSQLIRENAVIPDEKLYGYSLNKEHPKGGDKAVVFEKVLGYTQENAEELKEAILSELSKARRDIRKLIGMRIYMRLKLQLQGQ